MLYSQYSLTDPERYALSRVAETSLAIRTLPDFEAWIGGPVKVYFPHEMMVCATGQLFGGEIRIAHLIGVNCPPACVDRFDKITSCDERRIVQRWLAQYRAQIVNVGDVPSTLSHHELENVKMLGVRNLAAFGCLDVAGHGGTYFSFAQIPGTVTDRHAYKLELLLPYLHQAVTRIFHGHAEQRDPVRQGKPLTRREREILSLLATGMSNRAIAATLSRSELTVQNHVHAIFKKLGVRNRAAAVAHSKGYFVAADGAIHDGAGMPLARRAEPVMC